MNPFYVLTESYFSKYTYNDMYFSNFSDMEKN
jgi:hypothetical protein